MRPIFALASIAACGLAAACGSAQLQPDQAAESTWVVRAADLDWEQLNPARGDASPQAANLWGVRTEPGATGFILKPTDGFESPPHIHNVAYRGVVISGVIHNDDPDAEAHWMPVGSFWTQPEGGVHITAAEGADTLAYIEIDEGPFRVQPSEEAFDAGARPVNVDASNLVWVDATSIDWGTRAEGGTADVAHLWGDTRDAAPAGVLVRIDAGESAALRSRGDHIRSVVISGAPTYAGDASALEPGSLVAADAQTVQRFSCSSSADCWIYVRVAGELGVAAE